MSEAGEGGVITATEGQRKRGRLQLLLLVAFFLLPIVIVLGMIRYSVQPGGTSHGELLSPARPLHFIPASTQQGQAFTEAMLREKWSLLYVMPSVCDTACLQRIRMLRQVHASLGKEISRVQRIVFTQGQYPTHLASLQKEYPDLLIVQFPVAAYGDLLRQLGEDNVAGSSYLIDPLGNVMMRYAAGSDAAGIRKDMARLLHYAWAG